MVKEKYKDKERKSDINKTNYQKCNLKNGLYCNICKVQVFSGTFPFKFF